MHDSLETSYLRIIDTIEAELAPVGTAWKNSFNQDPGFNLFWRDTNLPDDAGTYLSACVLYSTIFQKSSVGLNFTSTLSEKEANFLQQVATYTVLPSLLTAIPLP